MNSKEAKDTKMAEKNEKEPKKLTLGGKSKGTLSLKAPVGAGGTTTRKNVAMSRSSKPVAVEVKKKRGAAAESARQAEEKNEQDLRLTEAEREARTRALQQAQSTPREASTTPYQTKVVVKSQPEEEAKAEEAPADKGASAADTAREQELAKLRQINQAEETERRKRATERPAAGRAVPGAPPEDDGFKRAPGGRKADFYGRGNEGGGDDSPGRHKRTPGRGTQQRRRSGKLTVSQVQNDGFEDRDSKSPSMAAQRRARERMRQKALMASQQEKVKQVREVVVPEVITIQELANRMAERVGDVVKKLMDLGIMATGNQPVDADTAELIVHEFGHTLKRVSESDVETGILGEEDREEDLKDRPPVVTIMGHVDHGKTSLLDAIRATDVVAGEAGGITQHIGAYQIKNKDGRKITFIDTPGHAAFTEMRARGADVTDIVILVVAADDSVMPQTVEAISHAKAAGKPMIIAINKCDLPDANPEKVRQELLQHEVVTESMGGDSQSIEVSAKTRKGLEELEEAILLQAEMLHLRANPDRTAIGAIVEARLEQGKGSVATVLVQKGTLKTGDVFVAGAEWGRIRTLHDDHGHLVKEAFPGQPIEVQGLQGTPEAGDDFVVVQDEAKASSGGSGGRGVAASARLPQRSPKAAPSTR